MVIRREIYYMAENYYALQNRFGCLKFIQNKLVKNVSGELEINFPTYLCTGKDFYKLYATSQSCEVLSTWGEYMVTLSL